MKEKRLKEKQSKKKKVDGSSGQEQAMFSGGFCDSDDDLSQTDGSSDKPTILDVDEGPVLPSAAPFTEISNGSPSGSSKKNNKKSQKEASFLGKSSEKSIVDKDIDAESQSLTAEVSTEVLNDDAHKNGDVNDTETAKSPKIKSPESGSKSDKASKKARRKSLADANLGIMMVEKPKKKKKRHSLGEVGSSVEVKDLPEVSKDKQKKNTKLTKRKSFGDVESDLSANSKVKTPKNNSERRKSMAMVDAKENGKDGEIEFWVPNKKYNGPMKGWFEEQEILATKATSPTTKHNPEKAAISFEKVKTPPAFVRRAAEKVSPKTDSHKKKKVGVHMKQNITI